MWKIYEHGGDLRSITVVNKDGSEFEIVTMFPKHFTVENRGTTLENGLVVDAFGDVVEATEEEPGQFTYEEAKSIAVKLVE